jgi:hypothetical protein
MSKLPERHPHVFKAFQEGKHIIRRTCQYWAGLSSDLVIEQTLMRSLKTTGGLTRGSGMSEEQRAIWTASSLVCSEYSDSMRDFNRRGYSTNEQHKETTVTRVKRDVLDLSKIYTKLETCSPLSNDGMLRNIITGVVTNDDVNVPRI